MSDYKKFVVPVVTVGLFSALCPAIEERQPHGLHHEYHPVEMPTISYYTSASSSVTGPVTFSSVVDSADVVLARHRVLRDRWQRMMGSTVSETPFA